MRAMHRPATIGVTRMNPQNIVRPHARHMPDSAQRRPLTGQESSSAHTHPCNGEAFCKHHSTHTKSFAVHIASCFLLFLIDTPVDSST